jgi:zinc protease
MVITVVGGIEPAKAVDQVVQALGGWENPEQPQPAELPPVKPLQSLTTQKVTIPGKSQSDIVMGVAGPQRSSPDYMAASLGNNILGQFGMMGRIGEAVREKAGLAYYASSHLSGGMGPGPWYVSMGVDPTRTEQAIELARKEIECFIREPVSEVELSDSQAQYIGRLPLSLESNVGVSLALVNLERYNLGLDYYQRYPDIVNACTLQEILDTAQRYLDPEHLGIAIAGP